MLATSTAPTHNGHTLDHYVRRMRGYIDFAEFYTIKKAYHVAPSTTLAILDDICQFRITVNDAMPFLARIAS